ncbi:MAG: M23 family metallopeptidase [Candidatus Vogelbacteria bacterium]|nr:M23 family metallopeptidase [Candidatus Vogelbacteria bacterium]
MKIGIWLVLFCPAVSWATDSIQTLPTAVDTFVYSIDSEESFNRNQSLVCGVIDGGEYRFLIDLNTAGQTPKQIALAELWLAPYIMPEFSITPMGMYVIQDDWRDTSVTWSNQPRAFFRREVEIPTLTETDWRWVSINFSLVYRYWKQGVWADYGLEFRPIDRDHTFNGFASLDYRNPWMSDYHPRLRLIYFEFQFPLSGGYANAQVSGYNFGDHWEDRYGLDGQTRLLHTGVDFRATAASKVFACANGYVKMATLNKANGGWVVVEHPNSFNNRFREVPTPGVNATVTTTYMHVIPLDGLVVGSRVYRGQLLGTIWEGNSQTRPHLHFQLRYAPFSGEFSYFGRLPERSVVTLAHPTVAEPAFPEFFIDPKFINWDRAR